MCILWFGILRLETADGCCYLAHTVEIFLLLGELVKGQESVAIAGGAVADPVAFPEKTPLPDDLSTFCSLLQVLLVFKHLAR